MKFHSFFILFAAFSFSADGQDTLPEPHLSNIKQLTFGGDNAEAYFSFDNRFLTLQITNPAWKVPCDQIYLIDLTKETSKAELLRLSNGKGRTTCSYFLPGNKEVLFASTHATAEACPPTPAPRKDGKYLWPVYSSFDIYVADLEGNIMRQLTNTPGYDAEATVSPNGKMIVFTSDRSGDMELYTMDLEGKNVKQITTGLGYDGGAFFSPDSKKLVFRASRPQTKEEIEEYTTLLKEGLVAPTNMELYTCNIDGSDLRQVTKLGKANWAPFFTPDGKKIIFSTNHFSKKGYDFQLFMIDIDGNNLEQVTRKSKFNAFPMFSFDGKKLVFSSNRDNGGTRETNVFIADWKP